MKRLLISVAALVSMMSCSSRIYTYKVTQIHEDPISIQWRVLVIESTVKDSAAIMKRYMALETYKSSPNDSIFMEYVGVSPKHPCKINTRALRSVK